MERIDFKYTRTDDFDNSTEGSDIKMVITDRHDEGLKGYDVCRMFIDFMASVGFGREMVIDFFRE